ncbi:MAG: error-prone DNA polymerase [Planctomycetota bacterium]|nr:error-prone DNA polymerase [Planctomycetota bacterium]MDA1248171.1 error-prone DNA polymerase [Planctomycetota bacterium]
MHCRTNFSFLEGASHPDELVNRAAELGLAGLAITDRNSVSGIVRAHVAAKSAGLKLLIGAEITPVDAQPVVLLATDRRAYAQLSLLITHGRRNAAKGDCQLTFDDVTRHSSGLLACVPLTRCLKDQQNSLSHYRECFGDRCYGLAELHRGPHDDLLLHQMSRLAREASVPLAAANDIHYHIPERQPLQDVLTAIRHGCPVAELGDRRFPNAERHLKSAAAMRQLFAQMSVAVLRTKEVADRCSFSLDELRYEYPEELCPKGRRATEYLEELTWRGASDRYPNGVPRKVGDQINHELKLIRELRYEAYFLTVWDLVRFARGRGILCQGRGSAANSAVCYCLGVTAVDPDRFNTLFERFISHERNEPPDIDIDFEHERREEVIQYIYEKYGRDRAGMTGALITYRTRSAIRDVGKALGFSIDRITRLSKMHDRTAPEESQDWLRSGGLDPEAKRTKQFLKLIEDIRHFPRHLSQHVGGMIFTRGRLSELVPIENASMPGRTVVQWDKDDLDALGILKVDCLSLGMLTAIRKSFDLIQLFEKTQDPDSESKKLTLASIPSEDPGVYQMIRKADTIGVFQIESRAQMSMLPRLKPEKFYDLVIEIAIVRPGPIQGDMVHPYLRRKAGLEAVTYPDDRIRDVLCRTLGVPIFQEQAMKLAVVAAGFTPGEADQLRRAMGAWRRQGVIDRFYQKFIDGMLDNGYDIDFAERVFKQIQGFGEYGFPESHSASFALLAYASAWLKRYHPAAFTAALINSQPMGFYVPAQLVADARRHGVEVRPVDVSHSEWDCTLEEENRQPALRLGFRMISGLPQSMAESIVRIRELRSFESFDEFRIRTRLDSSTLSRLSRADAFCSLKLPRRPALWNSLPNQQHQPLFDRQPDSEQLPSLPQMSEFTQIVADYRATGLSLKGHPLQSFRPQLQDRGVIPADSLAKHEQNRRVRVAGIVLNRQHPGTARGVTFMTLEDETGTANLIVHPNVWARFRTIARTATALVARGILQKESQVIHIIVDDLQNLSAPLAGGRYRSRDFH